MAGAPKGNKNAATGADNAPFKSALRRAIAQDEEECARQSVPSRIRRAAENLLTKASQGDLPATQLLADRIDGKAAQPITGADGGPIAIEQITCTIVDPKA